ncbi:MAG TPA: prolipoprotein diacylglyceryl transferase family protein [Anaerolineaceae bacterium]
MLPILQIGPLAIQTGGLLLLIGFWIGSVVVEKHAARFGISPSHIFNMVWIGAAAGIAGARLGYAIRFSAAFIASPLSLFSPNPDLLDAPSGLMIAGLSTLLYGRWKRMPLWQTLDALTSFFGVGLVAYHLANLATGNSFGIPTSLPWSIYLWGNWRHPVQLYEALSAVIIFLIILPERNARKPAACPGRRFWIFLALTASARLFFEGFYANSLLILDRIRLIQIIAWGILAVSLYQLGKFTPSTSEASKKEE